MVITSDERRVATGDERAADAGFDRARAIPPGDENGDDPLPGDTQPVAGPLAAARSTARPTFDQYLLAQVPFILSLAIITALIAYAAVSHLPQRAATAGGAAGGAAAKVAPAFSSETVAQQVKVAADPGNGLKWDRATYEAQAGDVSFVVSNPSVLPHNFAVEGNGVLVQSKDFGAQATNTYTIKGLPAGEYLLVCNYPGHREGGMISKLIVK